MRSFGLRLYGSSILVYMKNCIASFSWRFLDEDAKVKAQLEQANKTLSRELEEVKSTLSDTEQTLKTTEKQNAVYHDHLFKSSNTLMTTVKGMLAVLKRVSPPRQFETPAQSPAVWRHLVADETNGSFSSELC